MSSVKIGCCVRPEEMQFIADIGYDFAELSGAAVAGMSGREFELLLKAREASGIPCLRMNSALPASVKICGPGFDPAAAMEYAEKLCLRAHELGVGRIGVGSPRSRADIGSFPENQAWQQAKVFIEIFASAGEKYAVTVLWETLNPEETGFGISTLESTKHLVLPLVEKSIKTGLVADLYHMDRNCEGERVLKQVLDYVGHVHIAGNRTQKRGFPDEQFFINHREMFSMLSGRKNLCVSVEAFQGELRSDAAKSLSAFNAFMRQYGWG